jgi:uncharacterized protein YbcI
MRTLLSFLAAPFLTTSETVPRETKKKPTQLKPHASGINCVGLLVNGCFGRWPNNPLVSHPRTSIFREELIRSAILSGHHTLIGRISKTIPGISDILLFLMKTQGEIESAVAEGMSHFEQEYMGRGPKDVRAHLIDDLVVVRLKGVLTAAEQHLVKTLQPEKGRDLLKQVRSHLIEIARPMMEKMVQEITGVSVVSLHHDISTATGEEVVLFTLAESPLFRETKKR